MDTDENELKEELQEQTENKTSTDYSNSKNLNFTKIMFQMEKQITKRGQIPISLIACHKGNI
jgi:hypothetical protein